MQDQQMHEVFSYPSKVSAIAKQDWKNIKTWNAT